MASETDSGGRSGVRDTIVVSNCCSERDVGGMIAKRYFNGARGAVMR